MSASSGPSPISMPHPKSPVYPLNQCYLFRNTTCTCAALQVMLLFSEAHSHCIPMTPESPSFQFCSNLLLREQGMLQCTVSCTHGCKEIYFQVSTKCCSSGFLFHLRLPSLGRTLKKQAEQGVCALAVVQQGQAGCTLRSRIPAGAPCAALGGGNKAGSSTERVCLALLKSMQI